MHSFRAWVDEWGWNRNYDHGRWCRSPQRPASRCCTHLRLFDLDRPSCNALLRVIRRRRPFYFRIMVGRKYRTVLRLGRKLDV